MNGVRSEARARAPEAELADRVDPARDRSMALALDWAGAVLHGATLRRCRPNVPVTRSPRRPPCRRLSTSCAMSWVRTGSSSLTSSSAVRDTRSGNCAAAGSRCRTLGFGSRGRFAMAVASMRKRSGWRRRPSRSVSAQRPSRASRRQLGLGASSSRTRARALRRTVRGRRNHRLPTLPPRGWVLRSLAGRSCPTTGGSPGLALRGDRSRGRRPGSRSAGKPRADRPSPPTPKRSCDRGMRPPSRGGRAPLRPRLRPDCRAHRAQLRQRMARARRKPLVTPFAH